MASSTSGADHAPAPGTVIDGKYVVERVIGSGAMGVVVAARHLLLEHRVAIKLILPERARAAGTLVRFAREARAIAKLESEHVVRLLDFGLVEGSSPYMVMQYLEGRSLRDELAARGGALPSEEAVDLVIQACAGLAEAHARGVVHRDVKPANLFLTQRANGETLLKVVDFGVAKARRTATDDEMDLTGGHDLVGTPLYMSPEQIKTPKDVGPASDIWALGVVLHVMLSGKDPFAMQDATALLAAIVSEPPTPLRKDAPDADERLEKVVARCLQRMPAFRYASCAELASALSPFASPRGKLLAEIVAAAQLAAPSAGEAAAGEPPTERSQTARHDETSRTAAPLETESGTRPRQLKRAALVMTALAVVGGVAATLGSVRVGGRRTSASSPALSASAPAPRCATSAACTRSLGRAAVCNRGGACVALESDGCVVRVPAAGAVPDDSTIWIGMMFPRAGDAVDTLWGPAAQSVELAARDFNDSLGGIPDPRPGRPARPVGLVHCDDADDAGAARAAKHLVDLDVPAVIGFRSSNEVISLASSELIPHGVLAIAAFNKSSVISSIPHPDGSPRLVWRLAPSNAQDAAPLCALISDVIEPELRTGALGPRAPLRVTVVRPDSATGLGFENGVLARLRFNGKSLAENGDDFQELVFDETSADPMVGFIDKLLAFRPHVIAYPGDSLIARLPQVVESRWSAAMRPRYVFGRALQDSSLQRLVETRPDLARRIIGISRPSAAVANIKLAVHFSQVFGVEQTAATTTPNPYDALYLLAYAAIASDNDVITGAGLARAIDRLLPPGDLLEVGPARILEAYNALRAGKRIDLVGASGPLDFDTTTGDAQFDYVFECFAVQANRARRAESGLRFELASRKLAGSFACR